MGAKSDWLHLSNLLQNQFYVGVLSIDKLHEISVRDSDFISILEIAKTTINLSSW